MLKVFRIRQWTKILLFIFAVFFASFLVVLPESSLQSASKGALLWWNVVLPSLLPFFICFELFNKSGFVRIIGCFLDPIMKPLFNLPGSCGFALFAGITGGYPLGARLTASLKETNQITKIEAEHLLSFTNNSGPLFILGAVASGIFHNYSIGILLLVSHILSSITVGIIFKRYKSSKRNVNSDTNSVLISRSDANFKSKFKSELSTLRSENLNIGQIFVDSVKNSVSLIMTIGGFIIFFSVVINIFSQIGIQQIENVLIKSTFYGFFEITTGINNLQSVINTNLSSCICFASLILGFGGLCVHMQVLGIILPYNISIKPYLLGKMLHGIISLIYTWAFLKINPDYIANAESVFKSISNSTQLDYLNISIMLYAWAPIIFLVTLILIINVTRKKRIE